MRQPAADAPYQSLRSVALSRENSIGGFSARALLGPPTTSPASPAAEPEAAAARRPSAGARRSLASRRSSASAAFGFLEFGRCSRCSCRSCARAAALAAATSTARAYATAASTAESKTPIEVDLPFTVCCAWKRPEEGFMWGRLVKPSSATLALPAPHLSGCYTSLDARAERPPTKRI